MMIDPACYDTFAINETVSAIVMLQSMVTETEDPQLRSLMNDLTHLHMDALKRMSRVLYLQSQRDEIVLSGARTTDLERLEHFNNAIGLEIAAIGLLKPKQERLLEEVLLLANP